MPAPISLSAFGTLLKIGDGGGTEVFTTVAEVKDISGPGLTSNVIEVATQTSPQAFVEKIAGMLDAGEVTFDINFVPTHATHNPTTGLLRDYLQRTRRNFKLVFPDAGSTTWAFNAIVTGFEPSAPVQDVLAASVTLTLTGAPTLA